MGSPELDCIYLSPEDGGALKGDIVPVGQCSSVFIKKNSVP